MADVNDDIRKYLSGEMNSAERHALEKRALTDPFLADALEGAESIDPKNFVSDLAELDKRILKGKEQKAWLWPLRIAASFLVISITALLVYNSFPPSQPEKLAEQKIDQPSADESGAPSVADEKEEEKNLLSLNQPTREKSLPKNKPDVEIIEETPQLAQASEESSAARYGQGALRTDEIIAEDSKPEMESLSNEVANTEIAESKKEIAAERDESRKAKSSSPSPSAYGPQRRAEGKVTSADGSALAGVNVIIKGSSIGTVTDAAGNYSLPVATDSANLQFSALDKKSLDIIQNNNQRLDVKLKDDELQVNEIVVTGYELESSKNSKALSTSKLAEPVIGRTALKKFMEDNVRYPNEARQGKIEGKVVIEFVVRQDGSLTDFKVVRGLGYGCDEEVVRLIKEASTWSPTLRDNLPVIEKARVQFRFKLP